MKQVIEKQNYENKKSIRSIVNFFHRRNSCDNHNYNFKNLENGKLAKY